MILITKGNKNKLYNDLIPVELLRKYAFRANPLLTKFTEIRNSNGFDYIVRYVDPISGYVINQPNSNNQPALINDYWQFNWVNLVNIGTTQTSLQNTTQPIRIRETWVVISNFFLNLGSSTCFGYGTDFAFTSLDSAPIWRTFANNVRVNNILTFNMDGIINKQIVSGEGSNINRLVNIGGRIPPNTGVGWSGRIYDVLCFNDILDINEKQLLTDYLFEIHNI